MIGFGGAVLSALWSFAAWATRAVLIKALIYGFLLAFVAEALNYFTTNFVSGDFGLSTSLGQWTPGLWYFFDLFKMGPGMVLILSAYAARFFIRRIPFIG